MAGTATRRDQDRPDHDLGGGHPVSVRDRPLEDALGRAVPGGVQVRATDRLKYAHDASHYLLTPRAVVTPGSAAQVGLLLRAAAEQGVPLTFRSGGTSLSGQASTDGVLVDTRRRFRDVTVLDDGDRVRVQPGATLRAVNARLARYGRRLGPDPASEVACTIGGVVANNSSGMACGTEQNTYRTLESAVLVLPSGTVVDTGAPDADERLRALEPRVHEGLARLRDEVRTDPASVATIRRLFSIKNTMGYGVNAFLDHDRPVDLLTRLVVGSEGTLAFVAEATFRTVPAHAHAATALLVFDDLAAATGSLPALVEAGLATVELLDATSLRVAQRDPQALPSLRALGVQRHAALLVEHQEGSSEALAERVAATARVLEQLPLTRGGDDGSAPTATLSSDPASRAALWHIRKGLYATVAGARPPGTTALLEDVAVPVANLLGTCEELVALFDRHRYEDSVIFGHAKDGNVHFLLNEDLARPDTLERYLAFTEDMVDLVLGNDGTLKAEHGTGRIMAPFVRRQYGEHLYDVMRRLKQLLDPEGVLSPGVLLDDDPDAHVRHLKPTTQVEEEVDRCVECGYCEPVCPSRDLTTTPRQRIVLRREMAMARERGDTALLQELEEQYRYDAVDTCAVDGMCATACPVLINTGDLVRRLRGEDAGRVQQAAWAGAAQRWDAATRAAGSGLSVAGALPAPLPRAATAAARAVLGDRTVPAWTADLPAGGTRRQPRPAADPVAVYVPSCTTTMFGPAAGSPGVGTAFLSLCERAGVEVRVPDGVADLCCGTPWKSKGMHDGYAVVRERALAEVLAAADDGSGGHLPVVVDAVSCTEGLAQLLAVEPRLRVLDAVELVAEHVLPHLPVPPSGGKVDRLVLHPTCSSVRAGVGPALQAVAAAAAEQVVVPDDWGCCGFAGDRGLLHPELTAAATAPAARHVPDDPSGATAYASLNRTCEIGMTRATGQPYRHVLEVLLDVVGR